VIALTKQQIEIADGILQLLKDNNNKLSKQAFDNILQQKKQTRLNIPDFLKTDVAELDFVVFFLSSELKLVRKWSLDNEYPFEYIALTAKGMKAAKTGIGKTIKTQNRIEAIKSRSLIFTFINSIVGSFSTIVALLYTLYKLITYLSEHF
jgi:hypothetical protein